MPEPQLSPAQQKFFATTMNAIARAQQLAEEANKLKLSILAREWNYVGRCLEERMQMQLRALKGEPVFVTNGEIVKGEATSSTPAQTESPTDS